MNWTSLLFGAAFTIAGILFAAGRIHGHIAAWKTMPQEEKDRIRIVPLCRNLGGIITLSGVIFLLNGILPGFRGHWFVLAMVAWMIAAGLDLFFIEKTHRYEN